MSPLRRQTIVFLPSVLAGGLNSDPFWVDEAVTSAFREETLHLFEGVSTSLEHSAPLSTHYPLSSLDDGYLNLPSTSGGAEHVDGMPFTFTPSTMSFGVQPDDLFNHGYQTAYNDLFQGGHKTCLPAQAVGVYEAPPHPPALHGDPVDSITQTLSCTHLPFEQVDPSTVRDYAPSLDCGYGSQTVSTPEKTSLASPPSSSTSSRYDSSQLDGESDTNYSPPSDKDEEYHPIQATTSQKKRKARAGVKSTRAAAFSPTQSSASGSEKIETSSRSRRRAHLYGHPIPSRNFQRQDGARLVNKASELHCPVAGCNYIQGNQRIPDLNRHIMTHERCRQPEKWICYGVGMERAHLYGQGIEVGMSKEEQIAAGAYNFRGRLMIGGCLKTFARRDALKRHVDNSKICVGHMDSYPY